MISPIESDARTTSPADDAPLTDIRDALVRLEGRLDSMSQDQAELRGRLIALQDHANLVGHLVQQLRPGLGARLLGRGRLTLPLPLRNLAFAASSPRIAAAELARLERTARATSVDLVRTPDGEGWHPRFRRRAYLERIASDFLTLILGRRAVRYRVRALHPPVAPRRPKVLHVIPNVFVGGSTQLVVDLHERLGHRYEMQVLTAALPPGGRHEGMVIHQLSNDVGADSFDGLVRMIRPDLVHVHYWGDIDQPWYQRVFRAVLSTGAAVIENINTPVAPFVDPRIRSYIFVSDYVRQRFAPDLAQARVIHPGIDLERFRPAETVDPDARDSVGMVYRLDPDKLDPDALDPLILVAQRRPRTRIVVIGGGSLLEHFVRAAAASGVSSNFTFTGEVAYEALPDHLGRFGIFVAPVARESFGQVVPMAMAMGLAVAGNHVGALPEVLGNDWTLGRTSEAVADIILGLLDQPEWSAAEGKRNRERAIQFSVNAMIESYRQAYGQALGVDSDLMPGFPPAELFTEI